MSENPTAVPAKPDLVEAARKKRHLHLLRKLKDEGLSAREITELARFEEGSKPMEPDWRALDQTDVLSALGVSAYKLAKWVASGCPHEVKGRARTYDCGRILKWRVAYQQELDSMDDDLAGHGGGDALEEYRRVKVAFTRFDFEIKQGKHMEVEEVDRILRRAADRTRQSFQALPRKLAVSLAKESDKAAVEALLVQEIEAILEKLRHAADSKSCCFSGS